MARIIKTIEIPLEHLVLGLGQARTRNVGEGIDELADSIRKIGQLEPIVVCPTEIPDRYEILTGQRRFLACKEIGLPAIWGAVLDEHVDKTTAKVISVTENLVRRDLNRADLIDACTALYKKYGSINIVCDETGLPYSQVSNYVKYDRLNSELKELVDSGEIELKTALRAQDASTDQRGVVKVSQAVFLAKQMGPMSHIQQDRLAKKVTEMPNKKLPEVIEAAFSSEKIVQISVTLSDTVHRSLRNYAAKEGTNQDDAAASLIQEGLLNKGFVQEE